jgi:hypothetical protein
MWLVKPKVAGFTCVKDLEDFILFYNSCDIWWVSRFYANLMILDCSYGCIMVIMGRNRIEEINKGCHIYFVSKSASQGFS